MSAELPVPRVRVTPTVGMEVLLTWHPRTVGVILAVDERKQKATVRIDHDTFRIGFCEIGKAL